MCTGYPILISIDSSQPCVSVVASFGALPDHQTKFMELVVNEPS